MTTPATTPADGMSQQDARFAIDGAIAYGRMGTNEPPAGHWLTEYWHVGRQLAKLGETSAWDNQTPVDKDADFQFTRYAAMDEASKQASQEMQRLEEYLAATSDPAYVARLRNGSKTWLGFSKYRWDNLDSTWEKRVALTDVRATPSPGKAQERIQELERACDSMASTIENMDKSVRATLGIDPDADDSLPELVADWMEERASPGKAEAERCDVGHAHFTPFYLLANARRIVSREYGRKPNWVLAMELFAVGSTTANRICRDAGIDPDGFEVRRAAIQQERDKQ